MDNPGLNGARASLWDKPRIQETLQAIVARRETVPARRKDLFQEVVVHLWKLEQDYPGQRESWYLQRCRRRLQDLERAGHSLDSHKRLSNQVQPSPGTQGMFEPEAADDVRATVWLHEMMKAFEEELDPLEFRFLVMRLEERGTREIRAALGVSGEKMKQLRERLREAARRVGLRRMRSDRGSS